eukprot:scaffold364714_cov39-Prasinocladus_malaysianus.AAC.1
MSAAAKMLSSLVIANVARSMMRVFASILSYGNALMMSMLLSASPVLPSPLALGLSPIYVGGGDPPTYISISGQTSASWSTGVLSDEMPA